MRPAVIAAVIVSLAAGICAGSILGHHFGKQTRIEEMASANRRAEEALRQEQQALAKASQAEERLRNDSLSFTLEKQQLESIKASLTKDLEEARTRFAAIAKKSKDDADKIASELADGRRDQNADVIAFIDNPPAFTGKTLTARVKWGQRDKVFQYKFNMREVRSAESTRDKDGRPILFFYGEGPRPAQARIDLAIAIPDDIETPEAKGGDELLVTFKCGTLSTSGNVATRVIRPK